MRLRLALIGAVAALLLSGPMVALRAQESAPTPDDVTARFGTLAGVQYVALTPDGSRLIFISPSEGGGNDLEHCRHD